MDKIFFRYSRQVSTKIPLVGFCSVFYLFSSYQMICKTSRDFEICLASKSSKF